MLLEDDNSSTKAIIEPKGNDKMALPPWIGHSSHSMAVPLKI